MTEVERCFKAFEDSRERGETVSAFHFFHAGWIAAKADSSDERCPTCDGLIVPCPVCPPKSVMADLPAETVARILGDTQDDTTSCKPHKWKALERLHGEVCLVCATTRALPQQVRVGIPCCACDGCIDDGYQCIHNYCSAHTCEVPTGGKDGE